MHQPAALTDSPTSSPERGSSGGRDWTPVCFTSHEQPTAATAIAAASIATACAAAPKATGLSPAASPADVPSATGSPSAPAPPPSAAGRTTAELVTDLLENRPGAREAVARLLYRRVMRLAASLCGGRADAEDVTQQVLVEVLRDVRKYRFEGSFERWVDQITIRCALRTVARDRRRAHLLSRWLVPGFLPWGTDSTVTTPEPTSIEGLLGRLSPERREVVLLHHGLGYSVGEVSAMLDTPHGTVKDRLVHSKRQLRKLLRGELESRGW